MREFLKKEIKKKGSVKQLCDETGLFPAQMSNFLNGKTYISTKGLEQIFKWLNLNSEEMFNTKSIFNMNWTPVHVNDHQHRKLGILHKFENDEYIMVIKKCDILGEKVAFLIK